MITDGNYITDMHILHYRMNDDEQSKASYANRLLEQFGKKIDYDLLRLHNVNFRLTTLYMEQAGYVMIRTSDAWRGFWKPFIYRDDTMNGFRIIAIPELSNYITFVLNVHGLQYSYSDVIKLVELE